MNPHMRGLVMHGCVSEGYHYVISSKPICLKHNSHACAYTIYLLLIAARNLIRNPCGSIMGRYVISSITALMCTGSVTVSSITTFSCLQTLSSY